MAMYDESMFEMPHVSPAGSGPSPAGASTGGGGGGGSGGKGRGREGKEKESFDCTHPGCGQSYSRMEYLKRHQRKHQDVRPFNCKDCNKAFARSDVLLRHRRRCHPTPPPDSQHSPPTTGRTRSYPGVPVSSSRNDSRDLSPGLGGAGQYDLHSHDYAHLRTDGNHAHHADTHASNGGSRKHPREESGQSIYSHHAYPDEFGRDNGNGQDRYHEMEADGHAGRGRADQDGRAVRSRYGRDAYDDGSDIYGLRRSMRNELYDPVTGEYHYDTASGDGQGHGQLQGNGHGSGAGSGNSVDEQGDGEGSASYTPHLLPIFQHGGQQQQHQQQQSDFAYNQRRGHASAGIPIAHADTAMANYKANSNGNAGSSGNVQGNGGGTSRHQRNASGGTGSDPNHLEDASVLLSMAYGLDSDQAAPVPAVTTESTALEDAGIDSRSSTANTGSANNINANGNGTTEIDSSTGPTQDNITKAALDNTMNNLFGDMSWMGDAGAAGLRAAGPSEEQVQGVSDWLSGDMPLIDPALTGLTASASDSDHALGQFDGTGTAEQNGGINSIITAADASASADGSKGPMSAASISSASSGSASGDTPLSPFPLASLFSPSLFGGLPLPASGGDLDLGSAFGDGHAAGSSTNANTGTAQNEANSSASANNGGFNFDFGSPAGIYNTLNTLNMWSANGGGLAGGSVPGSGGGNSAMGNQNQHLGNGNTRGTSNNGQQNGNNMGLFNMSNNPFTLGQGWLSSLPTFTNGGRSGSDLGVGGNMFSNDAVNQFGFNDAQMSLLEQMAKYQMPQTRINPNPERPIMRIEHAGLKERQGVHTLPFDARFYLDPDRFSGCYQIPHWKMPPIRTLSLMASRTFDTVLNHFSFVHGPTFKLTDAAACLAFAICTIGGIRNSKQKSDRLLDYSDLMAMGMQEFAEEQGMDGPVLPEDTWEGMYKANYSGQGKSGSGAQSQGAQSGHGGKAQSDFVAGNIDAQAQQPGPWTKEQMREAAETKLVQDWDAGHTVRNEKTNMLVKSFSLAKGVLMTEYNVALLQALILYHAPYFLSEDDGERACANMFLGTIVNITRQIGFLSEDREHFETSILLPTSPQSPPSELNACWRRWIQLETRRRVAYLVYHLDTISSLESNIPCILSSCEMGYMPLPAPDTIWRAPTAQAWLAAVKDYRPMTLDEAMRRVFFLPSFGAFDEMHQQHQDAQAQSQRARYMGKGGAADACPSSKADGYNLLNEYEYGPFARSAMVLTLLRGVIDIGEGKRDRGDWRDLTDLWSSCSWLRPGKKIVDAEGKEVGDVSRESLRERFALGLQRTTCTRGGSSDLADEEWRQGWDFDFMCQGRGLGCTNDEWTSAHGANSGDGNYQSNSNARSSGGNKVKPPRKLTYCEEALPFYWLAQALLGILSGQPSCAMGTNQLKGVRYNEMLKSARRFTRTGEGAAGCAAAAAAAAAATATSTTSTGTNLSPSDYPTGGSSGTASNAVPYAMGGSDGSSVSPTGNVSGIIEVDGNAKTSTSVPNATSSGMTPDLLASWGSMAGLSPASFDSAISAAIAGSSGLPYTNANANANGNGNGNYGHASTAAGPTIGAGIQLTPPTMAGFASLPIGVGVGIGPGFGLDLGSSSGMGSGSGNAEGDGWTDASEFGF